MSSNNSKIRFSAKLLRPALPKSDRTWSFLVLPKDQSAKLPRRGRTSVRGSINGHHFEATLEPDGQLSHWLQVSQALREATHAAVGDVVNLELEPVVVEPEPLIPLDFEQALSDEPDAQRTWDTTTTVARLDWIHWIESAKQIKTRTKRISDACDMLASGKKRVCCFDQSGYYSKAFSAPDAQDAADGSSDATKSCVGSTPTQVRLEP